MFAATSNLCGSSQGTGCSSLLCSGSRDWKHIPSSNSVSGTVGRAEELLLGEAGVSMKSEMNPYAPAMMKPATMRNAIEEIAQPAPRFFFAGAGAPPGSPGGMTPAGTAPGLKLVERVD